MTSTALNVKGSHLREGRRLSLKPSNLQNSLSCASAHTLPFFFPPGEKSATSSYIFGSCFASQGSKMSLT